MHILDLALLTFKSPLKSEPYASRHLLVPGSATECNCPKSFEAAMPYSLRPLFLNVLNSPTSSDAGQG